MLNILVCDDNEDEANNVAALLGASGLDIKTAVFITGREALDYVISGAVVDACFLDIIMPEMNGIALAEQLRSGGYKGEIVFLTTSNDYAQESYRVKAFDYLLKPPELINVRGILTALEKARENAGREGLTVKAQSGARFVLFRDISHIEVIRHTVHIRLINGSEIKVYASFWDIAAELLKDRRFIQCHRSFLVNMNDIENITDKQIVMQNGAKVPISRGFVVVRKKIMKWLFGRK